MMAVLLTVSTTTRIAVQENIAALR